MEAVIRRLIARQFPRWADLPLNRVPSGGTVNALYRLGDDLVVRLPLTGEGDIVREREWLPRLAPLLPVAIPEVVAAGEPGEEFPAPWSVYRWLPGENPAEGAGEPLARYLAAFVAAMQEVRLPSPPRAYRGGPPAALGTATRAAIEELRKIPEEGIDCDTLAAVWAEAEATPWDGREVWLHADLMPGNLVVSGGRLTAVIDFGCAGLGDPACDLFPAWNLLTPAARKVFRVELGVDDETWRRGRARTLSQAVIALPYYRGTNPAMAANARYVLREVLAEWKPAGTRVGAHPDPGRRLSPGR